MPYTITKRGDKWCVVSPNRTHGCHDSRAKAIKQQRALYRNAPTSSEAPATMSSEVERKGIPVKDVALLKMALKRSERATEHEVEQAITIAQGLADPEVAAQTVALIGHLADRLRTAELNQTALVDVLQAVAADSSASRAGLLEALSGISERLAEAPQVNLTVPVPEVNVTVEASAPRRIE